MDVEDLLLMAAKSREPCRDEPWDYGWSSIEYRRSASASLTHDEEQAVKLSSDGVRTLEVAMEKLLRLPNVRDAYDPDELWSIVGSMIATLPMGAREEDLRTMIRSRLEQLRGPPQAVVQFAVCHVKPIADCLILGPLRLGSLAAVHDSLGDIANPDAVAMLGEMTTTDAEARRDVEPRGVYCAYATQTQGDRARREAEASFDDAVAIALMLEPYLDGKGLYSLRGDSYRPGINGLKVDRHALAAALKENPKLGLHMAASISWVGLGGASMSHTWFGEDPFPLGDLLEEPERRALVSYLLSSMDPVPRRLRLAARWHAKAHWSAEIDDAVIALGISFDVMLREKGNSPGRVHAERYAFLAEQPDERRRRYKQFYGEYYTARSAIVHGGRTSSTDGAMVRQMASDARQLFARLASEIRTRNIRTEKELDAMFEELKWGPRLDSMSA